MAYTKVKPLMVASFPSSRLTGAFGAISGANLTGLTVIDTESVSSDPTITTNPSGGVGHTWLNKATGELFNCTNATTDNNIWVNIGSGTGDVEPYTFDAIGDRGVYTVYDRNQPAGVKHSTYISIPTTGNSTDFGDGSLIRNGPPGGTSNGTRGLVFGGYIYDTGTYRNEIDYITISTPGNATDFGDLVVIRSACGAAGNVTRSIISCGHGFSGHGSYTLTVEYVTPATTGNGTTFGNSTQGRTYVSGNASDTRALFWGGNTGAFFDIIDYVTIATTGNATDFGDMSAARGDRGCCGNGIRGLSAGGYATGLTENGIDYVTIATTGNATDFGDMGAESSAVGNVSNDTRGVIARNGSYSGRTTEYVTIATTGNATSFGTIDNYGGDASCSGD
jgi:hypothetical protein